MENPQKAPKHNFGRLLNTYNRVRTGHGKPRKPWNFTISFSRPGKSWNLSVDHGKSGKMTENDFSENNKAR